VKLPSIRNHLGTILVVLATVLASVSIVWNVIKPAYVHPSNRTYTSSFGYPAVLRMRGEPFPVTTSPVTERVLKRQFLGEGLIESEPVRVPIVPVGRVVHVYVKEGDYVKRGQLMAELDPRFQEIKISQAQAAIDMAAVQLDRAKAGSPYAMAMERPEIVAAQLESAKKQYEIATKLLEIYTGLARTRTVPIETLLQQQLAANLAAKDLREARENIRISKTGRPLSVQAAELDLHEAQLKHQLYTQQLQDFKIYSPADGMIAQVLAHEGEYNQNAGSSAFVLAVGKWFGGNFDQTTIGRFAEGTPVNVRLEAFPGRVFEGRVRKIKPMVTYNPGGPEAARPIRPLGTGSPEWPATFITRIELVGDEQLLRDIVPGLTGFAEVKVERRGAAVPEGSLTSISGGKAMAYVVDGNSFHVQEVAVGPESDGWIEVTSGLKPGMEVIVDGYQVLQPGDRIAASPARFPDSTNQSQIAQQPASPKALPQARSRTEPSAPIQEDLAQQDHAAPHPVSERLIP
jgi:multidrug efflux pump subunit AcrA (membrane-fusion protein)